MERGPLREIEDTITTSPIMDCKRESLLKDDDKENIDFEITNKRPHDNRKSIFKVFDPLYESPVCVKKRENDVNINITITEDCPVDESVDFNSTFTATEILHYTTALEPKSLDSSTSELHLDLDGTENDSDFIDTEYSPVYVADYIVNILLDSVTVKETQVAAKSVKDMSGTITVQKQELSDLKLQVNQCQQVRATLELQLRQKEEIIIKTEAEFQRREVQYKHEIKQLNEKIEEKKEDVKDDDVKKLKEMIEKMKVQEKKLLDQLNKLTSDEDGLKQIMDQYEKTINQQISEMEKLKREHDTVQRHLATLELAFSDVHQKYERSKTIIEGYKNNEETMQQSVISLNETIKKNEERYESLKAHAKAQIDKSNKELNFAREKSQTESTKLTAIIKRLEIKNASLVNALEQKTKECTALAALCDEVTGHVE